jgi:farnesyl diphosphate synthase
MSNLASELSKIAALVEERMVNLLPSAEEFSKNNFGSNLVKAMNYSAFTKGKRIRPFLTLSTTKIFTQNQQKIDASLTLGAILEFIHVYSLIHDDLPAMDDDDFRRGKPSCHKEFNEATAILAGDSLLTIAFEILSDEEFEIPAPVKCQLINVISKAIGFEGMAGGQMMDLEALDKNLGQEEIFRLHHLKTGKLFIASVHCGAILGGCNTLEEKALINYATKIGLAFQIKDDLLDLFEEKNKPDPASFAKLIGQKAALEKLEILKNQAIEDLEIFDSKADLLRDLAEFIIKREV